MAPRFLGKDDQSPQGGSPSLWDDGETLIRFPKRLMKMFPELNVGR